MKAKLFILLALVCKLGYAQNVGIGTTSPDSSAALDIVSNSKGLLMPRLTTVQMNAIATPATGLAVYNTDSSTICVYMGSGWRKIVLGNSVTETDPKVGTLSNYYHPKWDGSSLVNSSVYDSATRVSIGTTNPDFGNFFNFSKLTMASGNGDSSDFNNLLAENTQLAPWMNWGKARGTLTTPLSVQNGDQLFSLSMNGYDSSGYKLSALIQTTVDGSPSIGKVPSRIGFFTTAAGSTSISERLRVTNAGRIGIGTTIPQSLLANTGTNILGNNGQGTNSNSLTWAMNSTGFVGAFYNSSSSSNAQGLAIKTAATASSNRILDLSTGSQATAGSTVMVVQADGKVGIGNSSPAYKLEVSGTAKADTLQGANFKMTNGPSDGYVLKTDDNGNGSWANPLSMNGGGWTINGNNHYSVMVGNVGIGNTNPPTKLSVTTNAAYVAQFDGTAALGTWMGLNNNTTGATNWNLISGGANFEPGKLLFRDNGSVRMVIQSADGNVGIGTTSPTEKLEVNGRIKTSDLQVANGAANGYVLQSDANGNASWTNPAALATTNYWSLGSGNLYNNSGTNLGIGTTAPTQKLHVKGSALIDSGRISFANIGNAIFVGDSTGYADDRTNNNSIFVGYRAGRSNVSGVDNIAIGYNALDAATTSNYNIAIGENVLGASGMSGNTNVAVGNFAMINNTTGYNNNALGQDALSKNTTGNNNTGLGSNALDDNTTGRYNTALGVEAMPMAITGDGNVAVGYFSGNGLLGGTDNVFVGSYTMSSSGSSSNTIIGSQAGGSLMGSGNIMIGFQAGVNETGSNKLIIDNSPTTTPLIYGDFANNKLTINDSLQTKYFKLTNGATNGYVLQSDANGNGTWVSSTSLSNGNWTASGTNQYSALSGNVGIGTASPSAKLDVQGTATTAANIQSSAGSANVNVAAASGQEASLVFKAYSGSGNANRWTFGKSTTAESTADAGSNFFINRYSDAGSYTGQPFAIARSNGSVTIGQDLADATANTLKINGSLAMKVNAFSNTGGGRITNMGGNDYAVIIGGNAVGNVVNLPTASTCAGRAYLIVNHAANDLTITSYTTAFGVTSTTVAAGATLQVMSDGSAWHKIN